MLHPRVTAATAEGDFQLRLALTDGSSATLDLTSFVAGRGGVFLPLQDPAYFALVAVDREAGTIVWPNGADLDPDVLYEAATR